METEKKTLKCWYLVAETETGEKVEIEFSGLDGICERIDEYLESWVANRPEYKIGWRA